MAADQDRARVDAAFRALEAAAPEALHDDVRRMMLMCDHDGVAHFKHADTRRYLAIHLASGTFRDPHDDEDGIVTEIAADRAFAHALS
jgi:hypothetical protein